MTPPGLQKRATSNRDYEFGCSSVVAIELFMPSDTRSGLSLEVLSCFGPPGFVKKEAGNLAWPEDNIVSPSSLARARHRYSCRELTSP